MLLKNIESNFSCREKTFITKDKCSKSEITTLFIAFLFLYVGPVSKWDFLLLTLKQMDRNVEMDFLVDLTFYRAIYSSKWDVCASCRHLD